MSCSKCARGLVEIRMHVAGRAVTFRRCGRCDSQAWETAEGEVSLDRVLQLVRNA